VKTRIGALWSMANIVTLTGLLGTVTGLIRTFSAVGDKAAHERQAALAHGISEALYNTTAGLGIAVICMIAHLLLSAAQKKVVADLESFSLRLENMLGDTGGAGAAAAGQ
jgi:biopolymer transport protein ExbB/TolQ